MGLGKYSPFGRSSCKCLVSPSSRCERASALLKQKIETEEDTKELGIKGVFQLQGGIDKYFKEYPTGGLWKGKSNIVQPAKR